MQCKRFRVDGSTCTNQTNNGDGWCRQADCEGFLRRDPATSPSRNGLLPGTPTHIKETSHVSIGDITVDESQTVVVTTRALDSFRFHHGGDVTQAEVQLRLMFEDFLLKAPAV